MGAKPQMGIGGKGEVAPSQSARFDTGQHFIAHLNAGVMQALSGFMEEDARLITGQSRGRQTLEPVSTGVV